MQRVVAGARQHRLLSLLQPWAADNASMRGFGTTGLKNADDKPQPRVPGARVEFKSPAGVTRPAESTRMAQEMGVEVEEAECGVEDQKVLTFRGKGPGPPGSKAPEQMKERDVFKASHDKQAEAIEQQAGAPSNPSESAQDKYAMGNQSGQHYTNGSSVPAAKGERLADAKYTAKAEDKISEARGKPAQGALNEEASVSRYNAMRAAAAAAINRVSDVITDTQKTVQEQAKETLDQSAKVVRDLTGMSDDSKVDKKPAPETRAASRSSTGRAHEERPGSKQATRGHTEEAAHRGERDAASY
ncbi:g11826 [Coccomyxa viridis]|uniref:G11826 protein n=1 Tax=Coccomyxa viridis TaxID=1274662 RepID=A0ABP1GD15_9CHLO